MSHDILLIHPAHPIPPDFLLTDREPLLPLGAPDRVRSHILNAFPQTDWSDPAWGIWEQDTDGIEFNLGHDAPVTTLMLHVRAGPETLERILAFCRSLDWTAADCATRTVLGARRA